jgi:hypothetical protein
MSKLVTITSPNGFSLKCSPEQAKEIMFNKPAGAMNTSAPQHVENTVLRKALENIKADTPEDFVLQALMQAPKKDGIHVVWNGLNTELKKRFNYDTDAAKRCTAAMKEAGLIDGHPVKGGYKIFLIGYRD